MNGPMRMSALSPQQGFCRGVDKSAAPIRVRLAPLTSHPATPDAPPGSLPVLHGPLGSWMQRNTMPQKMLIDATHAEETRVVVVDGNKVEEFRF